MPGGANRHTGQRHDIDRLAVDVQHLCDVLGIRAGMGDVPGINGGQEAQYDDQNEKGPKDDGSVIAPQPSKRQSVRADAGGVQFRRHTRGADVVLVDWHAARARALQSHGATIMPPPPTVVRSSWPKRRVTTCLLSTATDPRLAAATLLTSSSVRRSTSRHQRRAGKPPL